MTRPCPVLPRDVLLDAWQSPKTWGEWRRYYRDPIPLLQLIEQFCSYLAYYAGCDLAFVDAGLIDRPTAEVIVTLEYIADHLQEDSEVLATLYLCRESTREREQRWDVELRALRWFKRIGGLDGTR